MLMEIDKLEKIDKTPVQRSTRDKAAESLITAVNRKFQGEFGLPCPGSNFLHNNKIIKAGKRKFSKSYQDLEKAMTTKEKDTAAIKRDNEEKFGLIRDQEPIIHTTSISKRFGDARIEIRSLYDHLDALSRSATIYQFRIILDPWNTKGYKVEQHPEINPKIGKTTGYELLQKDILME